MSQIALYGFNNLTKSLSFSLYKLHYLVGDNGMTHYKNFISQNFNAAKLDVLLTDICHAIGGNILNVAKQDYQPQGASVTLMISEEAQPEPFPVKKAMRNHEDLVAHLDKSHLCIHTYPEVTPQDNIAIFRADIELSTCGVISPLKVINYVIEKFNADVVDIDYRVRGMTRDEQGKKLFIDAEIANISDHLSPKLATGFTVKNHNLPKQNLYHAKLVKKDVLLKNYLFEYQKSNFTIITASKIKTQIEQELKQLSNNSA